MGYQEIPLSFEEIRLRISDFFRLRGPSVFWQGARRSLFIIRVVYHEIGLSKLSGSTNIDQHRCIIEYSRELAEVVKGFETLLRMLDCG